MASLDADWDPGFPFTAFPRVHAHFEADRKVDKIRNLFLRRSKEYASKDLKGLADKDNPLDPVNRVHFLRLVLGWH